MRFQRLLFLFASLLISLPLSATPSVVVSIAPVHSLVAGVMDGVANPQLLITGGGTPHNYMLRPSQRSALNRADLVVWVGDSVESFLPRVIRSLDNPAVSLPIAELQSLQLLDARNGGQWRAPAHQHSHHQHDHGEDGHLWLDPINAQHIVTAVALRLIEIDPINAQRYKMNQERLLRELDSLHGQLKKQLTPLKKEPYLVFHDAYQYLEQRYDLNAIGALSVDPERKPGARRISEIRGLVEQRSVQCVFREPQFSDASVRVVTEGLDVNIAVLDPMGAELAPGPKLYFKLMSNLAKSLSACLSPN